MTRRKLLEIAYEYGRAKKSEQTGFLHFGDRIPLYDNLLFALVLFQTKTVDNVLEGVELVEKLLKFASPSGLLPRHLHEYPSVAGWNHQVELLDLLRRFGARFDTKKLEDEIAAHVDELHPSKAFLFSGGDVWSPTSLREWDQYLQMENVVTLPSWNAQLMIPCENYEIEEWCKSIPLTTFTDLYMASLYEEIPTRILKPSRGHLLAALLPYEFPEASREERAYSWIGSTLFVGTKDTLYSLRTESNGVLSQKDDVLSCVLTEEHPVTQDAIDLQLFFPSEGSTIFVNGEKQSTFTLGDTVTISHAHGVIDLRFSVEEGNGDFMGHLTRGDRTGQSKEGEQFTHYDHCITLRSLRRSSNVTLSVQASVGLSEASPIA